ncbi:MAG: alpha/beta hydrolase [Actinomycetota bacterium]|nr:alpha/beta hydrolase [Actinomycetota bacterium]
MIEDIVQRYSIAPTPPRAFASQLQGIMSWSDYPRLGELFVPVLVITGDQDILIPPENSSILAEAIPGCRLVVIPGGTHGAIAQFPRDIANEILNFLDV